MRSQLPLLLLSVSLIFFVSSSIAVSMAEESSAAVHIVYTERPQGDDHESVHLRTLSSVLGSEEKAKDSLVYVYKHAASGFSAKLTPEQVAELSMSANFYEFLRILRPFHRGLMSSEDDGGLAEQPGVLQVLPDQQYKLHAGPEMLH